MPAHPHPSIRWAEFLPGSKIPKVEAPVKSWLDKNLFAFFSFVGIGLIHWNVPQVRAIWTDLPVTLLWQGHAPWVEVLQAFLFIVLVMAMIAFYVFAFRAV